METTGALNECSESTCGPRSNGWELLIQRLGVVNIFKLIFDIKTDILVEKFELKILNFKIKLKLVSCLSFWYFLKKTHNIVTHLILELFGRQQIQQISKRQKGF